MSYDSNIPAAVPQQQAQVKVELKEGVEVYCTKDSDIHTEGLWYLLYNTTNPLYALGVSGDNGERQLLTAAYASHFDLLNPRHPESSEAKEAEPDDNDELYAIVKALSECHPHYSTPTDLINRAHRFISQTKA